MVFDAFRDGLFPTYYPSNKTPVTVDILEAGLLCAILSIAVSFIFVIFPGIRGKEKLYVLVRVAVGLFVVASILLCNFGQEWEVSTIETKTQYRAGIREEIKAEVGVKIGLRSVNITLKGQPEKQVNETINYNERFHWSDPWTQGRAGFGPYAGRVNQEFRAAQFKGLPYPILWVAEYFTLDGEGVRWGRHYRQAGFYAHIMMWTAFPLWILTLMLFCMVIPYGCFFMILTGFVLLLANIIYASIRNPFDLIIPFTAENKLEFHFGWCYFLNLATAILCMALGVVTFIINFHFPDSVAIFFGVDVVNDLEEYYGDSRELQKGKRKKTYTATPMIPPPSNDQLNGLDTPDGHEEENGDGEAYENTQLVGGNMEKIQQAHQDLVPMYRRRTMFSKAGGRSVKMRKPQPQPRKKATPNVEQGSVENLVEKDDVYVNAEVEAGHLRARYTKNGSNADEVHISVEPPPRPPRV